MMKDPILLIDGDLFCFQASVAVEKSINWGDDLWTLHSNSTDALEILQKKLAALQDRFFASDIVVTFSDSVNFRKEVLDSYKGNRKNTRKPLCYPDVVKYLTKNYKTFVRPTLEADDIMGILATANIFDGPKIIVTEDKDLKQIPGMYHRPSDGETVDISEYDADRQFYLQALHGDMTDGYGGCPGCGPTKAEKLLAPAFADGKVNHVMAWEIIRDAYIKAGKTEKYALTQARVARILRKEDYNFKEKKPILWSPKTSPKPSSMT